MELRWRRQEMGGNIYRWEDQEGWLYPALLKYFPEPPKTMYARMKELPAAK